MLEVLDKCATNLNLKIKFPHQNQIAVFFFVFGVLVTPFTFSQSKDRMLKIDLDYYNIEFKMPKGYAECDSGFSFYCGDGKITISITYSIIKKDSSVKIGLSFIPTPPASDIEILNKYDTEVQLNDANDNYLRNAVTRADTINHKIFFYNPFFAKRMFNADHVLSITRNCKILVADFAYNRIFFISKDNRCHVELTYLFTDKIKDGIESEFIKTFKTMIRFKD